MKVTELILNKLYDPRLKGVDVNSSELLKVHQRILEEKPLMRHVFTHFYTECKNNSERYFIQGGKEIEIGAGVSSFKSIFPTIISTDIKLSPGLDQVLDAQNMDIASNSVSAFYGINCFHHFPNPQLFFDELNRTLIPGGGCVLIEPHWGSVASMMYKRLFKTETFDKNAEQWQSDAAIMTGANQALSYLVFKRDFEKWQNDNPNLELIKIEVLNNYLQYLFSGGLNFRSLFPFWMLPVIRLMEIILRPFNSFFGLHTLIVIRKRI